MSIKSLIDDIRFRADEAGATLPMARARDLIAHILFGRSYSASIAAEREGRLPNPELTGIRTGRLRLEYGRSADIIAKVAAAVLSEKPSTLDGARSRSPSWTANLNTVAVHELMRIARKFGCEILLSEIDAKTFDEKKGRWIFRLEEEWYAEQLRFGQEAQVGNLDLSKSCFVHYVGQDGRRANFLQVCSFQDGYPRCIEVKPASLVKSASEERQAFLEFVTQMCARFGHTQLETTWGYADMLSEGQNGTATNLDSLTRRYLY